MLVWGLIAVVMVALAVPGIVALSGTCPARARRALRPGGRSGEASGSRPPSGTPP
jgi:hypothetical protein